MIIFILCLTLLLVGAGKLAPMEVESAAFGKGNPGARDCSVVLTVGPLGEFARISDALTMARTMRENLGRGMICIDVASDDEAGGPRYGTFDPNVLAANPTFEALPLLIDFPGVALMGKTVLGSDASGRPISAEGPRTTLVAHPPAVDRSQAYFLVTSTTRGTGNDVAIEGFVMKFAACSDGSTCVADGDCPGSEGCTVTRSGTGVWVHYVQDYLVRGNIADGAEFGVQHSFANGRTVGNLLTNNGVVGIIWRGPAPHKSVVEANTSTKNLSGGMFLAGSVGNFPLTVLRHVPGVSVLAGPTDGQPQYDQSHVDIFGNDFSGHSVDPNFSFGLRLSMFGPAPDTRRTSRVKASVRDNLFAGSSFGVVVDAGFPNRPGPPFIAKLTGRFERNEYGGHGTETAILSLTRFTATRNPAELGAWKFLQDSTYVLDHDGELGAACHDNRPQDPVSGILTRNVLRVNGTALIGLTCNPR